MNRPTHTTRAVLALSLLLPLSVLAQESAEPPTDAAAPADAAPDAAKPRAITVAVLDFEAKDPANPDAGAQIAEALTALLSGEPGFTLVDRAALARSLQEHELNLTGLVDANQAIQVGKLVGARIMVTGKAFMLGKQMFVTAKLIGTETSLVDGVLVKADADAAIDELVMQLAPELARRLRESGPKLVGSDAAADPLPALKAALADRKKPVVAVIIPEEHHAAAARRQASDPAVETEIKKMLIDCGFEVRDVKDNALADWARHVGPDHRDAWPRGLDGVNVVIVGEAFSEFAARIGNLVSCLGRAEVNLIQRADGKIALAERVTTRGVDLAEQIAGKKALESAGRELGVKILTHLAATLPKADDAGKQE